MSLQFLTPPVLLAGLGATALILVLLQRLRVRHRERRVVTTLFWRQAVEEARARVLVRRFRHPLAFLLFLTIAALLWLAAGGVRTGSGEEREVVMLVDGSLAMSNDATRRAAHRALVAAVKKADPDRTRVLWVGDVTRALLVPGEDPLLLESRLAASPPVAITSQMERVLFELSAQASGARAIDVHCFGPALGGVPTVEGLRVYQVHTAPASPEAHIAVLGLGPATDGRLDAVDVLIGVRGSTTPPLVAVDGKALTQPLVKQPEAGMWRIAGLAARGQRLTVQASAAHAAAARLPDLRPVRVAVHSDVLAVLAPVIESDPGLELVGGDSTADVAVRVGAVEPAATTPTLWLSDAGTRDAFVLHVPSTSGREAVELKRGFESLGLEWIDARQLAEIAQREIRVSVEEAPSRGLVLWRELIGGRYNFTSDRAFPLFFARALRWLSGAESVIPFVAAGEALPGTTESMTDAAGARLDPVGADFVPPAAGTYSAGARTLVASALDAPARMGSQAQARGGAEAASGGTGWTGLLLLVVFALLWVEWTLYRTERVP